MSKEYWSVCWLSPSQQEEAPHQFRKILVTGATIASGRHVYLDAQLSYHGARPSTRSARSALQLFDVHAETLEDKVVR
jgi:hypothetical protein